MEVTIEIPYYDVDEGIAINNLVKELNLDTTDSDNKFFDALSIVCITADAITILDFVKKLLKQIGNRKKVVSFESYSRINLDQVAQLLEDDLK